MKPTVLLASFSLPLFAIGCSVPKYQATQAAYRQAVVRGELKEASGLLRGSSPRSGEKCASELVSSTILASSSPCLSPGCRRSPGSWTIAESNHIWRKGSRDGGEVKRSRQPV